MLQPLPFFSLPDRARWLGPRVDGPSFVFSGDARSLFARGDAENRFRALHTLGEDEKEKVNRVSIN